MATIMGSVRRRAVAGVHWFVALAIPLGCVERLIVDTECGDAEQKPGEICFEDDHEQLDIPFEALAIRVAPFDGDALSDVLVTGVDPAGAVIGALSLSQIDGSLGPLQSTALFGCSAYPAVGDVGDGAVADLLFDACDDTMLVFRGRTDGAIDGPDVVDLDVATLSSALLDADGDGIGDVIALGTAGDTVAIVLARGSAAGGYLPPRLTAVGSTNSTNAPYSFSIGWIDDDDRFDLVLSHGEPTLPPTFVRGVSDGFGAPEPWDELGVASSVSFANTDGEGEPEIVVFRTDPPAIEVWTGRLGRARRLGTTTSDALADSAFAAGDFDADRNLDLALFDPDDVDVVLWLGDGRGTWREEATVRFGAAVEQLAVGDLDADGAADLVAGTFAQQTITVVRGAP
jgi:hypothetical protein